MTNEFNPTHKINLNGREILVQVDGLCGPAYTSAEWDAADSADWELVLVDVEDDDGNTAKVAQFLFQGQQPIGTITYETIRAS